MICVSHTETGNVKKVNQDSILVRKAVAKGEEIVFAAVCDGMGGLKNGELASAEVTEALSGWFMSELPFIVSAGLTKKSLTKSLNTVILSQDEKIEYFSEKYGDCGTTLAGVLLCGGRFLTVNVGDSRVYKISEDGIDLLTHDQTVVQRMLDNGEIQPAEAENHKMRSVLLQCIGVEGDVVPVYTDGTYEEGDIFVICSDGFRHKISGEEIMEYFLPYEMKNEKTMKKAAKEAVDENMRRRERDNISVVVIKT